MTCGVCNGDGSSCILLLILLLHLKGVGSYFYTPENLTIDVGDTVEWINQRQVIMMLMEMVKIQ